MNEVARRMKVYIAGPYTPKDGRNETRLSNIRQAADAAKRLIQLGHFPFCPHTMTVGWEDACSYEEFSHFGLAWLQTCDAILLLPDWEQSPGARREHEEAVTFGLSIIYGLDSLVSASCETMADKSGGDDHV
jgi:hypothetical protein